MHPISAVHERFDAKQGKQSIIQYNNPIITNLFLKTRSTFYEATTKSDKFNRCSHFNASAKKNLAYKMATICGKHSTKCLIVCQYAPSLTRICSVAMVVYQRPSTEWNICMACQPYCQTRMASTSLLGKCYGNNNTRLLV